LYNLYFAPDQVFRKLFLCFVELESDEGCKRGPNGGHHRVQHLDGQTTLMVGDAVDEVDGAEEGRVEEADDRREDGCTDRNLLR